MTSVLRISAGNNRGLWVQTIADREALLVIMEMWPKDLRAIAGTFPVRVAETDDGWAYLCRLAITELQFDNERLIAERSIERSHDEFEGLPPYQASPPPREPSGSIEAFKSEIVVEGEGGSAFEICPDGRRVCTGSWGRNHE